MSWGPVRRAPLLAQRNHMDNRKITTHYEDADGEREITVDVEKQDRFTAIVLDDLLGCPEDERDGIRERAVAAYWAAEHSDWLQTPDGEANGL